MTNLGTSNQRTDIVASANTADHAGGFYDRTNNRWIWRYGVNGNMTVSRPLIAELSITATGMITANGGITGALTGNATTATRLQTARAINGVNFDGQAAININKLVPISLEGQTFDLNALTFANGHREGMWSCLSDGGSANVSNKPPDNSQSAFILELYCPRYASATNYKMYMRFYRHQNKGVYERWCTNGVWDSWILVSVGGLTEQARKLAAARTLTIGNSGKTFDGTGNQSWSLTEIGAAPAHEHPYAAASHGLHVPTAETANNARFLRNDNSWQAVTPANIGAIATADMYNTVRKSCFVYEPSGQTTNLWIKYAETTLTAANTDHHITFLVTKGYGAGNNLVGILRIHARSGNPIGALTPGIQWIARGNDIPFANFIAVQTTVAGVSNKVELWAKLPGGWHSYIFTVLQEGGRTNHSVGLWTLFNSGAPVANPPTSTNTVTSSNARLGTYNFQLEGGDTFEIYGGWGTAYPQLALTAMNASGTILQTAFLEMGNNGKAALISRKGTDQNSRRMINVWNPSDRAGRKDMVTVEQIGGTGAGTYSILTTANTRWHVTNVSMGAIPANSAIGPYRIHYGYTFEDYPKAIWGSGIKGGDRILLHSAVIEKDYLDLVLVNPTGTAFAAGTCMVQMLLVTA
ncbi:MAG: hypothetical protein FWE62_06170 [Firmicutes bacterium]|nr:hypothetical protein [Bacillota bacterium]